MSDSNFTVIDNSSHLSAGDRQAIDTLTQAPPPSIPTGEVAVKDKWKPKPFTSGGDAFSPRTVSELLTDALRGIALTDPALGKKTTGLRDGFIVPVKQVPLHKLPADETGSDIRLGAAQKDITVVIDAAVSQLFKHGSSDYKMLSTRAKAPSRQGGGPEAVIYIKPNVADGDQLENMLNMDAVKAFAEVAAKDRRANKDTKKR